MKLDGLLIRTEPLEKILTGKKTWEIRGSRCHKRGLIALIESGTGLVVGTAEVVESIGPLKVDEWNRNSSKHRGGRIESMREVDYKKAHAWVLKNAKRLRRPVPYKHKQGVIVWHPVKI